MGENRVMFFFLGIKIVQWVLCKIGIAVYDDDLGPFYYSSILFLWSNITRLQLHSVNAQVQQYFVFVIEKRSYVFNIICFFLASPDHVIRQTTGRFSLRKQSYVGWGEGKLDDDTWPGTNRVLVSCRGRSAAIGIRWRRPSRPRPDLRPVLLTGPSPPQAYLI